jgi:hypothetical protein
MDRGFDRVDADLRALDGRLDSLQRMMLQIGGGVIMTLVGSSRRSSDRLAGD